MDNKSSEIWDYNIWRKGSFSDAFKAMNKLKKV